MFVTFPAGLTIYWLVNNVLSIAQQYLINRMEQGKKLVVTNAKGYGSGPNGGRTYVAGPGATKNFGSG